MFETEKIKVWSIVLSFFPEFLRHSITEEVAQKCSVKKVFLKVSQNSQENACASVSFLNKVAGQIFENIFFYRTPQVAASIIRSATATTNFYTATTNIQIDPLRITGLFLYTASKVSVFGVFLVLIFHHSV